MPKFTVGTILTDIYFAGKGDKTLFYIKNIEHIKETGETLYNIHYYKDAEDSFYHACLESEMLGDYRIYKYPTHIWRELNA